MWKRIITLTVLFCMALSLSAPALAYKHYSMEKREKESHLPYIFGDLAAARLAVYGFLDERYRTPQPETEEPLSRLDAVKLLWNAFAEEAAPDKDSRKRDAADDGGDYHSTARAVMGAFSDVPAEFTGQVSWAYQNDIVESITDTEFGVCPASETAFVSMLLNALGYQGQFEYTRALPFAASIGLTPLGLSASFTLGDAALYLQAAMDLQTADGVPVRERMNIPAKLEQATFPDIVRLTPLSPEDMEPQLREATRCLPQTVEISGEFLTKADLIGFFNRFYDAAGENWYTVRIADEYPPDITMDVLCCEDLPREEREEFDAVMDCLKKEWRTGALDDLDYMAQTDLECASRLCSGRGLTVRFLACSKKA